MPTSPPPPKPPNLGYDDVLTGPHRALAESWENTPHAALSVFRNPINSISLFVLLDLLGSAHPSVPSYFQSTHWAYRHLAEIESRLRKLRLLRSRPPGRFLPDEDKASAQFTRSFVDDDHAPFMARGVPVLHLIPTPFPDVWHRMEDDGEHLDLPTVHDWAQMTTAFVAEWMDLEGFFGSAEDEAGGRRKRSAAAIKTEL